MKKSSDVNLTEAAAHCDCAHKLCDEIFSIGILAASSFVINEAQGGQVAPNTMLPEGAAVEALNLYGHDWPWVVGPLLMRLPSLIDKLAGELAELSDLLEENGPSQLDEEAA